MKKLIEQLLAHPSSKKIVAVIAAFLLSSLVIEMLFTHFVLKTIYIAFQQFQVMFKQDAQDEKRDYAEMDRFFKQTHDNAERHLNESKERFNQEILEENCQDYFEVKNHEALLAQTKEKYKSDKTLSDTERMFLEEDIQTLEQDSLIKQSKQILEEAIAKKEFDPKECKKADV